MDKVRLKLSRLDPTKSKGSDGISPIIVKCTSTSICKLLHITYNKYITTGVFTGIWKLAYITPVFKNGSGGTTFPITDPSLYCPYC